MNSQTILIVEDEAEIREGIRILLSGENYTILEAENGQQGLGCWPIASISLFLMS
ncbi:response regulator [Sediminispirochaeta bajacaliforniensis]|uniref:hypothetical protein n=1 Tax=Sediminispirochaeta bajacaliforniensis TaxID=148 RepID=UPI0003A18C03|nr:hypothetical protein [Sediminispirochaeta bajacaliforniensis]